MDTGEELQNGTDPNIAKNLKGVQIVRSRACLPSPSDLHDTGPCNSMSIAAASSSTIAHAVKARILMVSRSASLQGHRSRDMGLLTNAKVVAYQGAALSSATIFGSLS